MFILTPFLPVDNLCLSDTGDHHSSVAQGVVSIQETVGILNKNEQSKLTDPISFNSRTRRSTMCPATCHDRPHLNLTTPPGRDPTAEDPCLALKRHLTPRDQTLASKDLIPIYKDFLAPRDLEDLTSEDQTLVFKAHPPLSK